MPMEGEGMGEGRPGHPMAALNPSASLERFQSSGWGWGRGACLYWRGGGCRVLWGGLREQLEPALSIRGAPIVVGGAAPWSWMGMDGLGRLGHALAVLGMLSLPWLFSGGCLCVPGSLDSPGASCLGAFLPRECLLPFSGRVEPVASSFTKGRPSYGGSLRSEVLVGADRPEAFIPVKHRESRDCPVLNPIIKRLS